MSIRNAAKAIIVHNNGNILLNKNQNTLGDMCYGLPNGAIYYDLPGGGQNQFETLEEAVKRECLEETGYIVNVCRLAAIYEEISMNQRFRAEYENHSHKVYFVFICQLADESKKPVTEKDIDMLCSEWIAVDSIKDIPLYPQIINEKLHLIINSKETLFLGSERI